MAGISQRIGAAGGLALLPLLLPAPAFAQEVAGAGRDTITAEEALYNADEMFKVKPEEEDEVDPCDQPDDPDVILICRQSVDPAQYMFERTTGADGEVTGSGAPRAADPGSEHMLQPCEAYTFCSGGIGKVPPPAIVVDFDALPETPAGSDAARLYGGPTDAAEIAARENQVGARSPVRRQEEDEEVDVGLETQLGLEDDVYGP